MADKALLFWSSGKDSAAALQEVAGHLVVEALLTTVNRPESRVAVHRVPESLLDRQASAMDLPLDKIVIPETCPNDEYESRVLAALQVWRERGVESVVFGDINLADIRDYRERLLSRAGMRCVFPLWNRDTRGLAGEVLDSGIRAMVTCVNSDALPRELAGREYDHAFLDALPDAVDPCGENGEFHTFVYDAELFARPVPCTSTGRYDDGVFSYAIMAEENEEPVHDH